MATNKPVHGNPKKDAEVKAIISKLTKAKKGNLLKNATILDLLKLKDAIRELSPEIQKYISVRLKQIRSAKDTQKKKAAKKKK